MSGYRQRVKEERGECFISGETTDLTVHHAFPPHQYPQWATAEWNLYVCTRSCHDLIEMNHKALKACRQIARRRRRAMVGKTSQVRPEHVRQAILAVAPELQTYTMARMDEAM